MDNMAKVLIACEESQIVTKEFRKISLEAFSCDIIPCSGGYPEWHIQKDVSTILNYDWDLIIAHPPCTHICVSGARWFNQKRKNGLQQKGIDFFMNIVNTTCNKIAIENPIGIMSTIFKKPNQIIQPWQFGHGEVKSTCLWLKNLPKLSPTNTVSGREPRIYKLPPSKNRSKLRSKTYKGVAKAMAEQWGKLLYE